MSFVPADYHTSSHNTSHPSLSLAPQQLEPHGHEAQFIPADPLWDDVLSFAEFGANTSPILSRQTSLQGTSFRNVNPLGHHHSVNGQPRQSGVPSSAPRVHQQSTRSEAIQHIVHPAVALQSPFDGAYTLLTHPSASFPVSSSSAQFGSRDQLSFSNNHRIGADNDAGRGIFICVG